MKKFILCVFALFLTFNVCFADELRLDKEAKYQKQVMQVGFRILNANQIEKRMTFYYINNKDVNAATAMSNKTICLYKGIIPFFDSDDELAAVLSHEIAHALDAHKLAHFPDQSPLPSLDHIIPYSFHLNDYGYRELPVLHTSDHFSHPCHSSANSTMQNPIAPSDSTNYY